MAHSSIQRKKYTHDHDIHVSEPVSEKPSIAQEKSSSVQEKPCINVPGVAYSNCHRLPTFDVALIVPVCRTTIQVRRILGKGEMT